MKAPGGSPPERIECERERIFKAMAVIECTRHALQLFRVEDGPDADYALKVAYEMLNSSAEQLEEIAEDVSGYDILVAPGAMLRLTQLVFGWPLMTPITYLIAAPSLLFGLGFYELYTNFKDRRRYQQAFDRLTVKRGDTRRLPIDAVFDASSFDEAYFWIAKNSALLHWSFEDARALLRLLSISSPSRLPKQLRQRSLAAMWKTQARDRRHLRDSALRAINETSASIGS